MAGPRSEPPIPILTMSVKRCPFDALISPLRIRLGEHAHAVAYGDDVVHHVLALGHERPCRVSRCVAPCAGQSDSP